jgi:predicted nucleotidyltransferase
MIKLFAISTTIVSSILLSSTFASAQQLDNPTSKVQDVKDVVTNKSGYITKLTEKDGKLIAQVENIQWFMGADAAKAIQQDNPNWTADECEPLDGYYIRDLNTTSTYEIADNAEIIMQTYTTADHSDQYTQTVDIPTFKKIHFSRAFYNDTVYHFNIKDNKIVKIIEQYIP